MRKNRENNYFQQAVQRIDRKLVKLVPAKFTQQWQREWVDAASDRDMRLLTVAVSRPARELLFHPGKRWRPLFGILMLEMMGVRPQPYELLLAALTEVSHTGALIIDDIEDKAQLRRGRACIHERYGVAAGINVANTLYFLPFAVIARHKKLSPRQKSALYAIMARQFIRAHLGQAADLQWQGRIRQVWKQKNIEPRILQAYADKSGAVVEGVCEIAAVIAGCSKKQCRQAADFGRSFGIAYQIIDDILDLRGFPGKHRPAGEDILDAKLTIVLVHSLRHLASAPRARLLNILSDPRLRVTQKGKREAVRLIHQSGGVACAFAAAQNIYHAAGQKLSRMNKNTDARSRLERLCDRLLRIR